jgi:hypothetical protein
MVKGLHHTYYFFHFLTLPLYSSIPSLFFTLPSFCKQNDGKVKKSEKSDDPLLLQREGYDYH